MSVSGEAEANTANTANTAAPGEATISYDAWDRYQAAWLSQPLPIRKAYVAQEEAILRALTSVHADPKVVLEVGPGFGRITKRLVKAYPALASAATSGSGSGSGSGRGRGRGRYYALDVTVPGLRTAEAFVAGAIHQPFAFTRQIIAPIQDPLLVDPDTLSLVPIVQSIGKPDLVVAVEVLMHVPHSEVEAAIYNLMAIARLGTQGHRHRQKGVILTCDWSPTDDSRPGTAYEERAAANGNYCHNYPALFKAAGATILVQESVGLQTIYLVRP